MLRNLLAATAIGLILTTSPGHAESGNAGQSVVFGMDVDAGTLDPRLARDTTAYRAADLIYSGLVQLTPQFEVLPDLAESWEMQDPQTFQFKLRPGLKFSDGSPLTADDVVFTFTTVVNPDFNATQRALYTPIEKIEKVDDLTVKFSLKSPYAPLLSYLDMGIVPQKLVEAGHDLATKPVGAGPMKLAEWHRGAEIVLEANPDYWAGAPEVDKLTLKVISDNSARAQAFEAGDLDAIQSPLSSQEIARLAGNDKFGNVMLPTLGITYLNFNTKDPLLAEPEMRRALAMLVDQETIVDTIYQGLDQVATSLLGPASWAHSADIRQPSFDVEGAKKLLGELGWSDSNGDGILDKDGKPLTITLATHSEDQNRVQAIEYIQAIMSEAGIDAKTQISDWPSFYANYVQKSQHQVALLGWLNVVDPDRLLFAQLSTGGVSNWGGYSNAQVDEALQEGRSLLSKDERAAAYRKAVSILSQEVPYYAVSYQGYQLFHSKDFPVSIEASPRGYLRGLIGMK